MTRKREHKPRHTTRERRLYRASARAFAAAFRAAFAEPFAARRAFRACVEWHSDDDAVARLWYDPDAFGASAPGGVPAAAADPAFIYWTYRVRRPRVLLIEAAAALWTELERRAQADRVQDADAAAHAAGDAYEYLRYPRGQFRNAARDLVHVARSVYDEPGRACRALLRSVRRRGVDATRRRLERKPKAFGRLVSAAEYLFGLIPYPTTTDARAEVATLLHIFDRAAAARERSGSPGALARAKARFDEAGAVARSTRHPQPSDALQEAARILAILYRRRAVDERPKGKRPPPKIERQLAAMLPASAAKLIAEAVRLSTKHSGEDPLWDRGQGIEHELGAAPRSHERTRDHDRGGIGL